MQILKQTLVYDAAELAPVSAFWAGLLGGTVSADDDWHAVVVDGAEVMGIQLAPDHVPPQWPDGAPQQFHLDLFVSDPRPAHDEAVALGARVLQVGDHDKPAGFSVYADPAGHPFCLCWEASRG